MRPTSGCFAFLPTFVFVASFAAFIALPFSDGWIAQNLDVGLFFMLAVMSLEVIGVILAGYSSGSKWALFGGMREAAQVVSYEIPMAICALIPVMAAGSLNLVEIGQIQSGLFWNWLVFNNPFTFLAFFVHFTVATASVKRALFDLAEAESELVAGFHTEYSGIRWSYFFMAEYGSMFAVSGIAVLLFLGGWQTGLNILEQLHIENTFIGHLIGSVVFISKSCVLVFVQMWVRWTLPRLRIDQVMMTCLKYLLPISCVLFLGATIWPLVLYAALGQTSIWRPLAEQGYRQQAVRAAAGAQTTTHNHGLAKTVVVDAGGRNERPRLAILDFAPPPVGRCGSGDQPKRGANGVLAHHFLRFDGWTVLPAQCGFPGDGPTLGVRRRHAGSLDLWSHADRQRPVYDHEDKRWGIDARRGNRLFADGAHSEFGLPWTGPAWCRPQGRVSIPKNLSIRDSIHMRKGRPAEHSVLPFWGSAPTRI